MECKDKSVSDESHNHYCIRIVPEWNVKFEAAQGTVKLGDIRIVPEWNVKVTYNGWVRPLDND